MKRTYQKSP